MATEFSRAFFEENRIVKADLRAAHQLREEDIAGTELPMVLVDRPLAELDTDLVGLDNADAVEQAPADPGADGQGRLPPGPGWRPFLGFLFPGRGK